MFYTATAILYVSVQENFSVRKRRKRVVTLIKRIAPRDLCTIEGNERNSRVGFEKKLVEFSLMPAPNEAKKNKYIVEKYTSISDSVKLSCMFVLPQV